MTGWNLPPGCNVSDLPDWDDNSEPTKWWDNDARYWVVVHNGYRIGSYPNPAAADDAIDRYVRGDHWLS